MLAGILSQIEPYLWGQMAGALMIILGVSGIVNTLQFASFRRDDDEGVDYEDFD